MPAPQLPTQKHSSSSSSSISYRLPIVIFKKVNKISVRGFQESLQESSDAYLVDLFEKIAISSEKLQPN
jgi:hypothetical protein